MKILVLCTSAFGGRGGIAKFNRDLSRALSAEPLAAEVTVRPWVAPVDPIGDIPERIEYRAESAGSKLRYVWGTLRSVCSTSGPSFDGIICGHIDLLPVAVLASWIQGAPLLLILHGIDAWTPHSSPLVRWGLRAVDHFVTVSQHTKERFLEWAPLHAEQGHVVPNCIDLDPYGPGPKRDELLTRYNLHGRTILLTLSRLSTGEQYKGHDEVLEVLPALAEEVPNLSYLICGDGDDRARLEAKSRSLGVEDRTVFAGYVPEEEKADHYRLADAFVMPGRGEGFGIAYLEALACGVPVVASSADASREAVRDGELGIVVDPDDAASIKDGVREALDAPSGVPDGLDYFSVNRFRERWHRVVTACFRTGIPAAHAPS